MEMMSGRSVSVLNPHAPLFVPMAYRAVEDFSDEWWVLVKSSPWFGDYWLRECFLKEAEAQAEEEDEDEAMLREIEDIFRSYDREESGADDDDEEKVKGREIVLKGMEKWRGRGDQRRAPKNSEKAPKIVKMKLSPRTIQQPR